MIKEIITDKERLSIGCTSIPTKDNPKMMQVVNDLLYTAKSYGFNCVGLAANQINYYERVMVVKINNSFVAMVNPEIHPYGKKVTKEEGCLSFPGKMVKMKRYYKVKIAYYDPINQIRVPCLKLKGTEARIVQHEIDHINGSSII